MIVIYVIGHPVSQRVSERYNGSLACHAHGRSVSIMKHHYTHDCAFMPLFNKLFACPDVRFRKESITTSHS